MAYMFNMGIMLMLIAIIIWSLAEMLIDAEERARKEREQKVRERALQNISHKE